MNSQLRICFVTREYPPDTGYGGIGTYYYTIARKLAQLGHHVVVLSEAIECETVKEEDGVWVYRILPRFDISSVSLFWRLNKVWRGYRLAVALSLRQIIAEHNVQIVESPEIGAEIFLFRVIFGHKFPSVIRLHSGTAVGIKYNQQNLLMRFRVSHWLEKHLLRSIPYITAPSEAIVNKSQEVGLQFERAKCIVIPNPVDTSIFVPTTDLSEDKKIILFVGRLEPYKGVDILVSSIPSVLAVCPQVEFWFVGKDTVHSNGEMYSQVVLRQIPEVFHSCLYFFPHAPVNKVVKYYSRASIIVVPSRWESFGLVAAEAMACGKAVVAGNRGGLAEVIEDGISGLLVNPESPQDLADSLVTLLTDEEKRQRIGTNARLRIEEKFSLPVIADRLVRYYARIVDERSKL